MNCGLGNLHTLKRELLLAGEIDAVDVVRDEKLAALGRGVASLFESWCGRRWGRKVGDTWEFPANVAHLTLLRYPIEALTSVEVRSTLAAGFVTVAGEPENFSREAGLVFFSGYLGGCREVGRVTWTGGYFIETREPDDIDFGVVPEGAEPLPAALELAWALQAKFYWEREGIENRAKAGFVNGLGMDKGFLNPDDELLAPVKLALQQFRRLG